MTMLSRIRQPHPNSMTRDPGIGRIRRLGATCRVSWRAVGAPARRGGYVVRVEHDQARGAYIVTPHRH